MTNFPFCGEVFTFKNPDILKSCQILRVQILGSLGHLWLKTVLAFLVIIRSHPPFVKHVIHSGKTTPPDGLRILVSICFVKNWDGYFSSLISSLPPDHWRRAFMAAPRFFADRPNKPDNLSIDFFLVQI